MAVCVVMASATMIAVAIYSFVTDIPLWEVHQLLVSVLVINSAFDLAQEAEEHRPKNFRGLFYFTVTAGIFNAIVAVVVLLS